MKHMLHCVVTKQLKVTLHSLSMWTLIDSILRSVVFPFSPSFYFIFLVFNFASHVGKNCIEQY